MKKLLLSLIIPFAMTQTVKSGFLVAGFQALKSRASIFFTIKVPVINIMQALELQSTKEKIDLAEKTLAFARAQEAARQLKMIEQSAKLAKIVRSFYHAPTNNNRNNIIISRHFGAKYPRK